MDAAGAVLGEEACGHLGAAGVVHTYEQDLADVPGDGPLGLGQCGELVAQDLLVRSQRSQPAQAERDTEIQAALEERDAVLESVEGARE